MHIIRIDSASANFLLDCLYQETSENPHGRPLSEITEMHETIRSIEDTLLEAEVRNTQPIYTHPDMTVWEHPELGDEAPLIIEGHFSQVDSRLFLRTPFYDLDDTREIFEWLDEKRAEFYEAI